MSFEMIVGTVLGITLLSYFAYALLHIEEL
jgi:hypothetical protein